MYDNSDVIDKQEQSISLKSQKSDGEKKNHRKQNPLVLNKQNTIKQSQQNLSAIKKQNTIKSTHKEIDANEQFKLNNKRIQRSLKHLKNKKKTIDQMNPSLISFNSAQPRRRSLFGQQHDLEIKLKKDNEENNSYKKKDTISSKNSNKLSKKKTLHLNTENGEGDNESVINKLIKANKLQGNQINNQDFSTNAQNIQKNIFIPNISGDQPQISEQENLNVSANKKINGTLNNIKQNPYDEFTLDDLKLLQETIQFNRLELEKELVDIQQKKNIKKQISFQPQIAKKWEKVKNSLNAFTVMKKIFSDIKKFGTSMQALSISDQVIDKCRDLLEKRQFENMPRKRLIYPDTTFIIVWQFFKLFIYFFIALYYPYKIFFLPSCEQIEFYVLDKIIEVIFLADIFIKLNTVIQNKDGVLIDNRRQIFIKYLKKGFIIDILCIIPYEIFGQIFPQLDSFVIKSQSYNEVLRIIRIPFLINSITIDQKIFDYFKLQSNYKRLIRFVFAVGIIVHIVGCLWVFIARVQYNTNETWIKNEETNIDIDDSVKVYLFAIYWCLQTLATVGFGDIHASNQDLIINIEQINYQGGGNKKQLNTSILLIFSKII